MAYTALTLGAAGNDGTGEGLRAGGTKLNTMLSELYGPVLQVVLTSSTALAASNHGTTIILGPGGTLTINATTLGNGFACKIINDTGADWTVPTPTGGTLRFDGVHTKVASGGSAAFEIYTRSAVRYLHVAGTTL